MKEPFILAGDMGRAAGLSPQCLWAAARAHPQSPAAPGLTPAPPTWHGSIPLPPLLGTEAGELFLKVSS